MDVGLVATVLGSAAGVAAVAVGLWQVRLAVSDRRRRRAEVQAIEHQVFVTGDGASIVLGAMPGWEAVGREVLEQTRRTLGNEHPHTLTARHNWASVVAEQRRWEEAEAGFRDVLKGQRRVLGNDHPDTLATRHNLAWVMANQGRWEEAEVGFRDVLKGQRRVLGNDHPDTQATRHNLAWLAGHIRVQRSGPG